MLKSNKLTSESALTTNRPTSRIDTSYLNRGSSQNSQIQNTNKKLWIKINKVKEDITDTKPYISIEKLRKTNSLHIRPSLNRKTSSDIKNQIDINEIKHYIQEVDKNYEDEPFSKQQDKNQAQQYQIEKGLNHLNLIFASFRERIKSRNIANDVESYNLQKYNNKIKIRSKQIAIIRQKSDNQIGVKIQKLRQENNQNQRIYNNNLKVFCSFRASSDYILNQIPEQSYQQISKLTEELGNLQNYNLIGEKCENQKEYCRPQTSMKNKFKKYRKFENEQDNQLLFDESAISETEAKLNSLYGESISIQKNLIQNQKSSPMKIINAIKKMDQIKTIINRVNTNKLMNKFII